ncbi:MAG: hypothetical protein U9R75_08870, partial [Candidatus Thermoplasmatota archaeon]|nr:hypothetical protein [Candidatus Thermoplasmatota archaeon]
WKFWFTKSYEMGELPMQTYNVVLYNMNPWLIWYVLWDSMNTMSAEAFAEALYTWDRPLSTYQSYTTYEDCLGWQFRGKATTDPKLMRWNMYDTDPCPLEIPGFKNDGEDTDGDRMEDNWDPRPTIPDDRLDTAISLYRIGYPQPGGGLDWYVPAFGPGNQFPVSAFFAPNFNSLDGDPPAFMHDYYGFPYRIIDSTMNKGMSLYMEIIVGIENGHPGAEFFQRGFYSYLNVSITFHNGSIDVDPEVYGEGPTANVSYDLDDDVDGDGIPRILDINPMTGAWIYNPEEAQHPMFALGLNDLNPGNIPDELYFDEFNPSDFVIGGFGPWPGPDDPYYTEATGERHDGLQLPFINVSNYPDPNALHFTGSNIWVYWSSMTFYKIGFHFMVPEGVMAGFVVMDMTIDTQQNIHVEESFDAFGGYKYIAY